MLAHFQFVVASPVRNRFVALLQAGQLVVVQRHSQAALVGYAQRPVVKREATALDQEQLAAWLGAVNDIRLVLGTRLEVSEDDEFDIDEEVEDTPESVARSAYWYLGWLLEHLVEVSASEL